MNNQLSSIFSDNRAPLRTISIGAENILDRTLPLAVDARDHSTYNHHRRHESDENRSLHDYTVPDV